ncbi:hypothetical protein [Streptomyces noursei]|uniref:hypothetical protein n=1 Tax=Streptomyces noursei TaxID=1971 RepID=UPI0038154540
MERIKVTEADVKRALVEAVTAKGYDYVYDNGDPLSEVCWYVHQDVNGNDVPGCLVGDALHRLGVPLGEIKKHEERGAYGVAGSLIDVAENRGRVLSMLSQAQDHQDTGGTWGGALAHCGAVSLIEA